MARGEDGRETGYIALHRRIRQSSLWPRNRPFSHLEAWMDMLMEARWAKTPGKVRIGLTLVPVKRGEFCHSLRWWAERWHWSPARVRRFLACLESDRMIDTNSSHKATHVKVVNYDTYNPPRNASETQTKRQRNASETELEEREEGKKERSVCKERHRTGKVEPL